MGEHGRRRGCNPRRRHGLGARALGEEVRRRMCETSGVKLASETKRVRLLL